MMNQQQTTFQDEEGNEEEKIIKFCLDQVHMASNLEAPKNIQEALYRDERKDWITSVVSEIMSFPAGRNSTI
jgi:hypothetical protein